MNKKPSALVPVAPGAVATLTLPAGYDRVLADIKQRIRVAQVRAGLSANLELLLLYYDLGMTLEQRTQTEAWGSSVIDRLAHDLQKEFPGMDGLSPRNLRRMRAFYRAYPLSPKALAIWPRAVARLDLLNWPRAVAKLPWGHNVILLEKVKDATERGWYAQASLEHNWSRDILALQIDSRLYHRKGKAVTNFSRTLPAPQSEDKPTIGLLLCRTQDRLVAEYALRDIRKPIGVAQWKTQLTRALPDDLKSSLPSIEEIEAELARDLAQDAAKKGRQAGRRGRASARGRGRALLRGLTAHRADKRG